MLQKRIIFHIKFRSKWVSETWPKGLNYLACLIFGLSECRRKLLKLRIRRLSQLVTFGQHYL